MQKTLMPLIIAISLLPLTACKPNPDMTHPAPAQTDNTAITEATTAKSLTKAVVSASENQLTNELICTRLSQTINKIDNTSKIEDIYALERQLNACLPIANNSEILKWLTDYQAMYARFLSIDHDMDDENFYTIMSLAEQHIEVPSEHLKTTSPRLRYLIKLVESDADVSILYIGEGLYVFHHDLQAMADLFAPYLPSDQAKFVERMAMDNQDIFWNDAAVAVPFAEVIDRAIFWENYIQTYPDSYFIKNAKNLFKMYRYTLFFGSDNTDWIDDLSREFYDPAYEPMIRKLSARPNSILAKDAKTLLKFMAMSDNERKQKYPTDAQNEENSEWAAWAKASEQLNQALPIPSPWGDNDDNNYRDCLSSIICIDYDY
ncbi:hypothetical protein [Psychrobacter sp. DM8]|uniref:hypothetical protein n=1 Tax=Psychrobacter sp. DM8 TaxID=3440636 RepID=UPI003F4F943D